MMRARWRTVIARNTRAEEMGVASGESQRPVVQIALALIEGEVVSYGYLLIFGYSFFAQRLETAKHQGIETSCESCSYLT